MRVECAARHRSVAITPRTRLSIHGAWSFWECLGATSCICALPSTRRRASPRPRAPQRLHHPSSTPPRTRVSGVDVPDVGAAAVQPLRQPDAAAVGGEHADQNGEPRPPPTARSNVAFTYHRCYLYCCHLVIKLEVNGRLR